ncbi:MAG: nucleotidyltransferase [Anaerolineaceae bacterium]|nr:MAG: nucleotidyltransferase [Anaerolineaceae bacterium]
MRGGLARIPRYNGFMTGDPNVKNALRDLLAAMRELYGGRAPRALLYGSQARGDATDASDVDVLLVYPDPIRPSEEIGRLETVLADLNLSYGVLISILPVSSREYRRATGPLWKNIKNEGVLLDAR